MGQSAEGTVLGIGGIFLRAHDPAALAGWYRDNLGIVATKAGEPDPSGQWSWQAGGGETVFSAFPADSDYFAADRQFMINFRVAGLDSLVTRLAANGIAAERRRNGTTRTSVALPGFAIPRAIRSNCGNRRRVDRAPLGTFPLKIGSRLVPLL